MKLRARELCDISDQLFKKKEPFDTLLQEIAENFYPERADFRTSRHLGYEFASNLMTGAPVMMRRDLANQFNAMLRPRGKEWFSLAAMDERLGEQRTTQDWMRMASGVQRRAMYDINACFVRATKEGDNDFAAFGQAVITVEVDRASTTLLYRCWHLRDMAWAEDDRGRINDIHRKAKQTARDLVRRYGEKVPQKIRECMTKEPHREFDCRHIVVPYDEYEAADEKKRRSNRAKYMSLYVLRDEETVLKEEPVVDHAYVIPRWQTVSGYQYAHSPCTVIALPDARLLQRINYTLIEAGEKATNPPMIGVQEAIRSDIAMYAGGFTAVDAEYDERLGEVLRPLNMDKSGLQFGAEMADKREALIKEAFFLNQISLPAFDGAAMTATEIRARTQEYVRAALPLFEPMETEYNGAICDKTFHLLLNEGTFGEPETWPKELRGEDAMKWQFDSPITDAAGKEDAHSFQEAAQLLALAAGIDPSLKNDWDIKEHFRRGMRAIKAPLVDQEQADEAKQGESEMAGIAQMMGMIEQGAGAAAKVGEAGQSLAAMEGLAA